MNHDSIESSSSQEPSQSEKCEPQRPVLGGKELMSWTIKALPHPTRFMDIGFGIVFVFCVIAFFNGVYETYILHLPLREKTFLLQMDIGIIGMLTMAFLWKKAVRQKNVYHYRITDEGGEVEYHIDFPEGAGVFFTILSVVFLVFVFVLIAYNPSFIWMLAGPVGMGIVAARFFLNWENKKKYDWFRWDEFNKVIIDRKRKVVVFLDHPLAFEAFLSDQNLDEYIDLVKCYMPSESIYLEEPWVG